MNTPFDQKSNMGLRATWNQLIEPSALIVDKSARREAKLGSTLAIGLFLVNLSGLIASSFTNDFQRSFSLFWLPLLTSAIGYFLSRTQFFKIGALLFITGFCFSVYPTHLNSTASPFAYQMLLYFPLGFIIGSALLSQSLFIFLIGINISSIFFALGLGIISPNEPDLIVSSGLSTSIGIVLASIISFRRTTEGERLEEVNAINEELKMAQHNLEQHNDERANEINLRSKKVEAITSIAQQLIDLQDMEALVNRTVELIASQYESNHTAIYFADQGERNIILLAASSEAGKTLIEKGFKLEINKEKITTRAAYQKYAVLETNIDEKTALLNNPELPETRAQISLPLLIKSKLIGVLDIHSTSPQAFEQNDMPIYQALAWQVATAINNLQITQMDPGQRSTMQASGSEDILKDWGDHIGNILRGYQYTPLGITALRDLKTKYGSEPNAQVVEIPITLRGKNIGRIKLTRKGHDSIWTEKERELVTDITSQIGLALENARLLEDLQQRAAREQKINDLSSRFSRSLDFDSLLQTAVREIHQLPNVNEVTVFVGNKENEPNNENGRK